MRLLRALASICALAGALTTALPAQPAPQPLGPRYFDYQVKLKGPCSGPQDEGALATACPDSPSNPTEAIATLDARKEAVLAAVACGDMLDFAEDSVGQSADSAAYEANEDSSARIMAKIGWGRSGHTDSQPAANTLSFCRFSRTIRWGDLRNAGICRLVTGSACSDQTEVDRAADRLWADLVLPIPNLTTLKDKVLGPVIVGDECQREVIPTGGNEGMPVDRAIVFSRRLDPFDSRVSPPARTGAVQIDFAVSQGCLLREAAQALNKLTVPVRDGSQIRAGTKGQPCRFFGLFGKVDGDWDMAERNLVRIAYLIRKYGLAAKGELLEAANMNLRINLLTLDRGLEGDSHNVYFGCGNSEGHTGSAEDRAVDRNGHDNPPGDALGDLGWFLLLLVILIAVLAALAALAAALNVLLGLALAGATFWAIVAGVVVVLLINISETENHLLGINTTKYLNNQLILEDLGNDLGVTSPYIDDQIEIKEWLLKRMQGFLQNDFIEYNAHPYQRHSIESIRNLYDFAGDPGRPTLTDQDLRNGAQLVLDYTAAKFAVGSSQSRRMVPYRRHRSDFAKTIDADATDFNGFFDLSNGADHQVGLGLLYSGQTQQLPLGQASRGFAEEVINAVTSDYIPEATILDLAIVRNVPIYQRIHHTTEEIYSSGRGFVISAGGLATGLAYPVTGISFIDQAFTPSGKDDWGSGVPTTLFLGAANGTDLGFLGTSTPSNPALDEQRTIFKNQQTLAGPGRAPPTLPDISGVNGLNGIYAQYLIDLKPDWNVKTTLGELLRIKGEYYVSYDNSNTPPQKLPTYDNNLCVWDGFACGTNLEFGSMGTDCSNDTSVPPWTFIDSQSCAGRKDAPRTLIAILKKDCPSDQDCTNYGFFEVMDAERYAALIGAAPDKDLLIKFRNQITTANAILTTLAAGKNMVATYHSARGQAIEFSCWGHESDSDNWGIYRVNGVRTHDLGAWPFAGGEWSSSGSLLGPEVQTPMRSTGDGVVEITSPGLTSHSDPTKPRVLRLDFNNRDHPKAAAEN